MEESTATKNNIPQASAKHSMINTGHWEHVLLMLRQLHWLPIEFKDVSFKIGYILVPAHTKTMPTISWINCDPRRWWISQLIEQDWWEQQIETFQLILQFFLPEGLKMKINLTVFRTKYNPHWFSVASPTSCALTQSSSYVHTPMNLIWKNNLHALRMGHISTRKQREKTF